MTKAMMDGLATKGYYEFENCLLYTSVLGLLLLLSVVSAAWAQERQDTIVVSRDGTGNFRTLPEAIAVSYTHLAGAEREFNPMTRKWETHPIIMPVFY